MALAVVLGPAGIGMSMAMAGMWGGMAGGALTGGLEGGWKGMLIGAAMGGTIGYAVGLGGPLVGAVFLAGGAAYAGATDSWDSFAGGFVGGICGAAVGGGIVNSQQFQNWKGVGSSGSNSQASADVEAQYALTTDQSGQLSPAVVDDNSSLEIYWRKLERNDWIGDAAGRVHPFMRDTWNGEFHELQAVKNGNRSIIKILEGGISKMSKGTQNYWKTGPKPDQIVNVSKSKFYQGITSYKAEREGQIYRITFSHKYDCQGFKNYVVEHSEYGK